MRRGGLPILASACAVLLATGCSAAPAKTGRTSPDAPVAKQCPSPPEGARRVVVNAVDGTKLGAALLGRDDAPVGLVVNYGRSATLCDWLVEADRLARAADARILVVDRRGTASSDGEVEPSRE